MPRKKQKTANGRGCQRYKKYSGNGAGHNTNECRHWNADGTVNPVWNKKSGGKKTNTKRGGGGKMSVSYLTSKVKKQEKTLKKLTKRLKSHKGKGKSESDSSTSSSDDSKWQFGSDVTGNHVVLNSKDSLLKENKSRIDSSNNLSINNVVPCLIKDITAFSSAEQGLVNDNDKMLDSIVKETGQVGTS